MPFHERIATQRKTRGDAGRLIVHARREGNDLTLNGLSLAVAGHDGCHAGRVGREDLAVNDFTLGREEVNAMDGCRCVVPAVASSAETL